MHDSLRFVLSFKLLGCWKCVDTDLKIAKIHKYHVSLLSTEESTLKLSEAEQRYATSYKKILNRHMMDSFLKDIPERLRGLEDVRSDVNMGTNHF